MPLPSGHADTPKPTLLVVSHTYVARENRKKIGALAEHFAVTCVAPLEMETVLGKISQNHEPESGFSLQFLPTLGNPQNTTRYLLKNLGDILRKNDFAVIIAEAEPWSFLRWQLWWLKRRFRPKALFGEFSWENLERPGWKGRILGLFYRAAALTGDFAIAGNAEGGVIAQKYGRKPGAILVAPQLGVDETVFTVASVELKKTIRQELSLPDDAFLIGFCGRFEAYKGLLDLVEAVALVRERQSGKDIQLVFLGDGPLRAHLEDEKARKSWIHLLPPRTHSEIPSFLQTLDLLALPSCEINDGTTCWKEQFGHILIEAMACGVPVVGSASGAIPEVIGDPDLMHNPADPESLAQCLGGLLSNLDVLSKKSDVLRRRVADHFTNRQLATKWSGFINKKIQEERKSVLWVDPHLKLRSPSMRHLIYSIPRLRDAGWNLRAWCFEADDDLLDVEIVKLWCPNLPGSLPLYAFFIVAHLFGGFRWLIEGRSPARITHAIGGMYLNTEIATVQFINSIWMKRHLEIGFSGLRETLQWLASLPGVLFDTCQFNNPKCQLLLPVSEALGKSMISLCRSGVKIEVFPNSYDETRFNSDARNHWRSSMRKALEFSDEEFIFIFVSQGHYRRKGFWLAIEALSYLRTNTKTRFRFMVVGGNPKTLRALQLDLTEKYPDWDDWIKFVGPQKEMEKYYAAADAFLFPSYFEAFCLAEIEAAACGLPLLLTPHHGSEMILRDQENGISLSFDPAVMSRQLQAFLDTGLSNFQPDAGLALTRGEYAVALARIYEKKLTQHHKCLPLVE